MLLVTISRKHQPINALPQYRNHCKPDTLKTRLFSWSHNCPVLRSFTVHIFFKSTTSLKYFIVIDADVDNNNSNNAAATTTTSILKKKTGIESQNHTN